MKTRGHVIVVKVYSGIEYYNANTGNRSTGDCVKRALTVAYSMDYDDVSRELNKIKRETGASAFNEYSVFLEFMSRRGDQMKPWEGGQYDDGTSGRTLEDFCQFYPKGVYLVLVGKKAYATHMAAVVDGTIYDSWNSSSWTVFKMSKVSTGKSGTYELAIDEFIVTFEDVMKKYIEKMQSKCPDTMELSMGSMQEVDKYTFRFYALCKLSKDISDYSSYYRGRTYGHEITIKLNPRLDYETNFNNVQKRTQQRMYDWIYTIRKDLLDAQAAESINIHPKYYDDVKDLMKLPEWSRPLVRSFQDVGSTEHAYMRYTVHMDPLPGDPSEYDVWFEGDTLAELRQSMNEYKNNNFSREPV